MGIFMRRSIWFIFAAALCPPAVAFGEPTAAVVETTLGSASGQIRQFAFDGDPETYFASEKNAGADDHFTLVFDKAAAVKSIEATTGKPKGGDALDAGALEVSEDGKKFEEVAKFEKGAARVKLDGRKVRAVRLRPTEDLKHPLAIREIAIESDPEVLTFKYPVEFVVDVSDAPEMKEWAEKSARVCERQYRMINEELKSDGFKPPTVVKMTLKTGFNGVASTSGGRITGSVKYFKAHPEDLGAMVHETVHVVQSYRTRDNPGWLVEGIADYIRFFKYEPGKLSPPRPAQARYNGSYRVTASFLGYLTEKYDKEIVRKLNQALREGEYKEELFKTLTKKTIVELDEEWRASLKR
jgi:hypothetical protein